MGRIIPSPTALFLVFVTLNAFEIQLVPEGRIAVQIGQKLTLTCLAHECDSPAFSWRTQFDNPLGGKADTMGNSSVLTMESVGLANEHGYLCTATCDNVKKEKSIDVQIYSFPSDPVFEFSMPLYVGEKASVTCIVPEVYPAEHLEMQLEKEGSVLARKEFYEEEMTKTVERKSLTFTFVPTFEDIGKEITCVADLPIESMEFEPQKRHISQRLNVNFGPQNTSIVVSPCNTVTQGETLVLTCRTRSNPSARIVWRKELPDSSVQHLIDNDTLIIPHPQMRDSGLFICEAINDAVNKIERTTVVISVQAAPRITEFSIQPSTVVQEGDNVTILCSVESNPAARIVVRRKSDHEDTVIYSEDGIVHIPSVTFLHAGTYECEAENALGERKMAAALSVEYGPRNTMISVTPSASVREGEAVTMTCTSCGNPSPEISWAKRLTNGKSQFLSKDATLTINNVKADDWGLYECAGVNQFGRETKTVELIVHVHSQNTDEDNADEGETGLPKVHPSNTTILSSQDGTSVLYSDTKNYTDTNLISVYKEAGNKTDVIDTAIVALVKKTDYIIPVIVVLSCLSAMAVPALSILIYMSRKAKINGSYNIVNPLKPCI